MGVLDPVEVLMPLTTVPALSLSQWSQGEWLCSVLATWWWWWWWWWCTTPLNSDTQIYTHTAYTFTEYQVDPTPYSLTPYIHTIPQGSLSLRAKPGNLNVHLACPQVKSPPHQGSTLSPLIEGMSHSTLACYLLTERVIKV